MFRPTAIFWVFSVNATFGASDGMMIAKTLRRSRCPCRMRRSAFLRPDELGKFGALRQIRDATVCGESPHPLRGGVGTLRVSGISRWPGRFPVVMGKPRAGPLGAEQFPDIAEIEVERDDE